MTAGLPDVVGGDVGWRAGDGRQPTERPATAPSTSTATKIGVAVYYLWSAF